MKHAFICDAIRTPFGRYGGTLANVRTDDLAALPITALIQRNPAVDWAALDDVPYGATTTYGEIAARIGASRPAVRAVGGAIGANPLLILRPCHRVIGADGSLTGYAGGLERKTRLLTLEGAPVSRPAPLPATPR